MKKLNEILIQPTSIYPKNNNIRTEDGRACKQHIEKKKIQKKATNSEADNKAEYKSVHSK